MSAMRRGVAMRIEVIETNEGFERVRPDWERVHAGDPASDIFTTWAWFRGWLAGTTHPWRIFALHDGERYVGFFPLSLRERSRRGVRIAEFFLGGTPCSDHAGFICLPDYQREAVAALASALRREDAWNALRLQDVFDPKVDLLVAAFSGGDFEVRSIPDQGCPCTLLPASWDEYLQSFTNHTHRKKFRRIIREIDAQEDFRVEFATPERFKALLDIFLKLFRQRWPQVSDHNLAMKRTLLGSCFEAGTLLLPVLFYLGQPIAATAIFVDRKNSTLADYNGGWDQAYPQLSPGIRLQCYMVHYGITHGFRFFDFLRGEEPYKVREFGATLRYNRGFVIHRKDLKRYWEKGLDRLREIKDGRKETAGVYTAS